MSDLGGESAAENNPTTTPLPRFEQSEPCVHVLLLQGIIMGLSALPSELLEEVAWNLVPTMDADLGSYQPDPEINTCRLALLALAKTNRTMNAVAIRHLYHTVCITDIRALFEFLGTLILHDHLADLVRVLSIATSLEEDLDTYTEKKSGEIFAGITGDMTAHGYLSRCFDDFTEASELTWSNCDGYAESACALLLCLATKLDALSMHCPNWNAGEYEVLTSVFETSYQEGVAFVKHLSRLSLIADPTASDPLLPAGTPQSFMGSGNIKNLELFGANLFREDTPISAGKWRNLETVRISYAYTTGAWWYRLCKEVGPNLRTVDISISPYFNEPGDETGPGYNDAFQLCAASLEHLRFNVAWMSNFASHLGPGKRLSCLPSLLRLKHLEVSVTVLFESPVTMGRINICDILPSSLERLCLCEEMWEPWQDSVMGMDPDGLEREHARLLKRALFQLALQSEEKLPWLRWVGFRVSNKYWAFDETELKGLCTVSKVGSIDEITCVPRHIKGGGLVRP